jgi:2-oxoglutarate ferredoxin oxidoreductase subunit beta
MRNNIPTINKKDFDIDGPVKWCPGCGGHAVLSAIKKTLPNIGVDKDKVVFVSGIGCSSRFPYYINTYGFHSLHGRAFAIASGIKIANPELSVWVITGDGDSMAIGGNHFIHLLRRNLDINVIMFNNKIYGLTKGQYSPTTPRGSKTKTSPEGSIENPFMPGELAMGSQGTFYGRTVDTEPKIMQEVFMEAAKHKGTSLVEVLQNCVIFNNQVHSEITGKEVRRENQIYLEHSKPMIFGTNNDKGIVQVGSKFMVAKIGENGVTKNDILIHDAEKNDDTRHYMLARMTLPDYPVAMGVIRSAKKEVYEESLKEQIDAANEDAPHSNVNDLLHSGNIFEIN